MNDINQITLSGRLANEPSINESDGTTVAEFTLAVNRGEEPEYIPVVAFNGLAENTGEHLNKGSRIALEGRIRQDAWETEEGSRSRLKVQANFLQFLDR